MAFSKSSRPRRPGAFVNFEAAQQQQILPSQGSIVAVEGVHNWGPFKTPTLCTSWDQFVAIYGADDSELSRAVRLAFIGEAVLGRGGAGGVLASRWGGASAARASKTLQNTAPANAIRLRAKYEGTNGNNLRVTTQDHAGDATKNELLFLDGATLLETYVYTDTDIQALVDEINANSDWVDADGPGGGAVVTGTALAAVSSQAFTTGDDGAVLTGTDWIALMAQLAVEEFGLFAPANLTDGAILASLVAWSQAQQAAGQRFTTVVGGGGADDFAAAIARAHAINDPNFVCLGVGTVEDDDLGVLTTAQLAPRIAGILAARGDSKGLSMARLGGVSALTGGATPAQIDQLYDAGVTILARDTYRDAPIRIDKGLTAFSTTNDATRPHYIFSNPKFVRTMQLLEDEVRALGQAPGFLGELPVNDQTRTWAVGEVKRMLLDRERPDRAALQPGSTVAVDQAPPPSDDDEYIALRVGLRFGRSAEQFFLTVTVA